MGGDTEAGPWGQLATETKRGKSSASPKCRGLGRSFLLTARVGNRELSNSRLELPLPTVGFLKIKLFLYTLKAVESQKTNKIPTLKTIFQLSSCFEQDLFHTGDWKLSCCQHPLVFNPSPLTVHHQQGSKTSPSSTTQLPGLLCLLFLTCTR